MNKNSKRVLIIEDNPDDVLLIGRLFAKNDIEKFDYFHVDRISAAYKLIEEEILPHFHA